MNWNGRKGTDAQYPSVGAFRSTHCRLEGGSLQLKSHGCDLTAIETLTAAPGSIVQVDKHRGMIVGLDMSENLESLAKIYWATIQSICFGTKHIMDKAKEHGYHIESIIVCGGVVKNSLYLQELANICECDISVAGQDEAVLFGSALISTIAAGIYPDYRTALKKMAKRGDVIRPLKHTHRYYRKKYEVYLMYSYLILWEDKVI